MEIVGFIAIIAIAIVVIVALILLFRSWGDLTRYRRIRKM